MCRGCWETQQGDRQAEVWEQSADHAVTVCACVTVCAREGGRQEGGNRSGGNGVTGGGDRLLAGPHCLVPLFGLPHKGRETGAF